MHRVLVVYRAIHQLRARHIRDGEGQCELLPTRTTRSRPHARPRPVPVHMAAVAIRGDSPRVSRARMIYACTRSVQRLLPLCRFGAHVPWPAPSNPTPFDRLTALSGHPGVGQSWEGGVRGGDAVVRPPVEGIRFFLRNTWGSGGGPGGRARRRRTLGDGDQAVARGESQSRVPRSVRGISARREHSSSTRGRGPVSGLGNCGGDRFTRNGGDASRTWLTGLRRTTAC